MALAEILLDRKSHMPRERTILFIETSAEVSPKPLEASVTIVTIDIGDGNLGWRVNTCVAFDVIRESSSLIQGI